MKSVVLQAISNSRWLCLLRAPPNLQIWSSCIDVSDLSLSYVISRMLNKYLLLLCSVLNTQELPDKGCELNKRIVCLVWEHKEFYLSRYLYLHMSSSLYLSVKCLLVIPSFFLFISNQEKNWNVILLPQFCCQWPRAKSPEGGLIALFFNFNSYVSSSGLSKSSYYLV